MEDIMNSCTTRTTPLDKADHVVDRLTRQVIVAVFSVMVLATWIQAISRYFFNHSLGWSSELGQVCLFWIIFPTVAFLAANNRVMRVDAFLVNLPAKTLKVVEVSTRIMTAGTFLWMAWLGMRLMELSSRQTVPGLNIPQSVVYMSMPLGLLIAAYFMLRSAMAVWKTDDTRTAQRDLRDH